MDERLRFVARRLAGEPMAELCREFGISRKTAIRSSIVIRNAACRGSRTEADARIATPTDFRSRWKTSS
jgi:putative transposase